MKKQFSSLNDLKKNVEIGQLIFIENHFKPERSRVTKVVNKLSYFFTVDSEGKESWIINGASSLKEYGFNFKPDFEKVEIYFKANNMPFLTLHFNNTIISGKTTKN